MQPSLRDQRLTWYVWEERFELPGGGLGVSMHQAPAVVEDYGQITRISDKNFADWQAFEDKFKPVRGLRGFFYRCWVWLKTRKWEPTIYVVEWNAKELSRIRTQAPTEG
jgi:hypothetical protein